MNGSLRPARKSSTRRETLPEKNPAALRGPQTAPHRLIVPALISQCATAGSIARMGAAGMAGLAPSKSGLFPQILPVRFGLLIARLPAMLFGLRLLARAPRALFWLFEALAHLHAPAGLWHQFGLRGGLRRRITGPKLLRSAGEPRTWVDSAGCPQGTLNVGGARVRSRFFGEGAVRIAAPRNSAGQGAVPHSSP